MKYLILDGCPRKGNTWKVTEAAIEQIKEQYPDSEFEELNIYDQDLPFCTGCSNCFRIGHEKCPHYGIIGNIIEKMERADGVIVCSTTYNWRETSVLKNLFDHFCFMLHRPHLFRGKALVITTTGGTGAGKSAKSIASTLLGIGLNRCYRLSIAAISWNAYVPGARELRKISKKTSRFAKDVRSRKLHAPSLLSLIPYNIMRGMGQNYAPGSEYPTADGVFWTDAARKGYAYFPEVRLSLVKRAFGQMFYTIGKTLGGQKSLLVTYKK
ncbi:MAG TPA: NADPH-dependent oxidoreductase [Firmicutes bacterium]|jgi:multimeric flavodoxin WrbA|nr:NADPH-dependent oxidoreductase [Bacillota bacterium]HAZ23091.1 NADPH-dependent oxidoreductase [Bacillota bacterium]HBE06456.1 NADPH-dependent oxidoreductase [Bacillota bacterium]HBL49846.1 NADPH-dependent oxidoreductase [Bacillota bacterium]HBL67256.1 NADPH-dependent oxidoreductase [Bacillota bacterium]